MSDPQPTPGKKSPPRAEPLQPDRPGSGDDAVEDGSANPAGPAADERRRQQSDDALKNVRDGYD